ncbi:hypothetical protein EDL99_08455 [Ornithobacterium rhinotracheale]|uniref:hypothetical protein n=1 Tax=Ornithobacterium rhinotracheale TaxID=28251 RepID=UPI00129C8902|nr:hypothetical protein [Ornithobacterium rhinotracheale]MRJ08893.1 hypothetical protein [Ornithobacterium rhinotracheale]UOH77776.1 hypothetical protein MT996_11305 [Ornithobacterium rhinotracheale]
MKNVFFKSVSHSRYENGVRTKREPNLCDREICAERDMINPDIYHVSIKIPNYDYTMVPKAMKIVYRENNIVDLKGVTLHDSDNRWGFDFSDYGVRFVFDVHGGIEKATLYLIDRNTQIVYQ